MEQRNLRFHTILCTCDKLNKLNFLIRLVKQLLCRVVLNIIFSACTPSEWTADENAHDQQLSQLWLEFVM